MATVSRKLTAEFIGVFGLVFGGCASTVLAAAFPEVGLGLTLIQLFRIPVTNLSVNTARGTGPAFFAGGGA